MEPLRRMTAKYKDVIAISLFFIHSLKNYLYENDIGLLLQTVANMLFRSIR